MCFLKIPLKVISMQFILLYATIVLKVVSCSFAHKPPTAQAHFYKRINSTYETAVANETGKYSFSDTVLLLECHAFYPVEWIGHHNKYFALAESRRNVENFEDPPNYQYTAKVAIFMGFPLLKQETPLSPTYFKCTATGQDDRLLQTYAYMTVYDETPPVFSLELASDYRSEYLNFSRGTDEVSTCPDGSIPVPLKLHRRESYWNCTFYDEIERNIPTFLKHCETANKCNSSDENITVKKACFPASNQINKECKKVRLNRFLPELKLCLEAGNPEMVEFDWSPVDPSQMLFVHPPEKTEVYLGEEVVVHCEYSRFYFSLGSWFAVKHPDGHMEYIRAFERRPCLSDEFFAWKNEEEFKKVARIGCKWTREATRFGTVTSTFRRRFDTVGRHDVFCIGPVWNNSKWVNASLPIMVTNSASLELKSPEVVIRSSRGDDFRNESLKNVGASRWHNTFFLDCKADYPIEWIFHRKEQWKSLQPWNISFDDGGNKLNPEVTRAETRREADDFEDPSTYSFTASITLQYIGTVTDLSHFTCASTLLNIPKLETHVRVKDIESGTVLQLEVSKGYIENNPEPVFYGVGENNCPENLLYHQEVQSHDFCWMCHTSSSAQRTVFTMSCKTPTQCSRLSITDSKAKNCIQKVNVHSCAHITTVLNNDLVICSKMQDTNHSASQGTKSELGKTHDGFLCPQRKSNLDFSASVGQCVTRQGPGSASALIYFGIINSAMEESEEKKVNFQGRNSAPLYTNWKDVDPSKMLYLHSMKSYIAPGETVEFKCEYSRFYFSFGAWFGLRLSDGNVQYFPADDLRTCYNDSERGQSALKSCNGEVSSNASTDATKHGIFTTTFFKKFEDIGRYQFFCFGPVWNTTEWVNSTRSFEVIKWEDPAVVFIAPDRNKTFIVGEKSRSLKCKFKGNPTPNVSWAVPEGHGAPKIKTGSIISTLIFDEVEQSSAGTYACHVKSLNHTHFREFAVNPETRLSGIAKVAIVIACTAVLVGMIAVVAKMWLTNREMQKALRLLTDDEVREFKEGVQQATSSSDYINNVDAIESLPYDEKYEIELDRLIINYAAVLGQGEYGLILKARLFPHKVSNYASIAAKFRASENAAVIMTSDDHRTGRDVAVKVCKKKLGVESFKSLLSELKVMAYIGQHENIVSLLGAHTGNIRNRDIHIAEELCHHGSLDKFVQKHKKAFFNKVIRGRYQDDLVRPSPSPMPISTDVESELTQSELETDFSSTELIRWTRDIAAGVEYIHSKRVIHGDLALRNVLITKDFVAKIGDFGLSRRLGEVSIYTKTSECPLPWRSMAIESLQDLHFSVKSDMWSFGVTLWELFTLGNVPYRGMNYNSEFVKEIEDGSLRLSKPHYAPSSIYDFMVLCWEKVPEDRPSIVEIRAVCDMLLLSDK